MIRAIVVEDSPTARVFLVALLGGDEEIEVVGEAADGAEAVELVERLRPDVVLMDVHMPRLDGYEASRRIMEHTPTPIVLTSATLSEQEIRDGLDALAAGALVLLRKPSLAEPETAETLVETVKLMAEIKVVRRWARRAPVAPAPRFGRGHDGTVGALAIGASTGGPPVVAGILGGLSVELPFPVLLVQHIAPEFTDGFAGWLGTRTQLTVKVAVNGEAVRGGTVYVAPAGSQMGLTRDGRITLTACAGGSGYCPSITHLFDSLAEALGAAVIGVLLTGMGRDGAAGLRRLRDAGALTIAQDEPSSAVYGMPAEAARLDAAELVLAPEAILDTLRSLSLSGVPR